MTRCTRSGSRSPSGLVDNALAFETVGSGFEPRWEHHHSLRNAECNESPTSTTEGQIFHAQSKRSIQSGGEKLRFLPSSSTSEKPFQGYETTNNETEGNRPDQNASANSPSSQIGLKLGLTPCTPSIAVASKTLDNTGINSVDDHIFTAVLPRSLTDSDIIYHSSEKVMLNQILNESFSV
ncbi:unnamed protein product [Trichobilharzia regenti]|nr:unnamed protein product [Trichobilharzia regenti]